MNLLYYIFGIVNSSHDSSTVYMSELAVTEEIISTYVLTYLYDYITRVFLLMPST